MYFLKLKVVLVLLLGIHVFSLQIFASSTALSKIPRVVILAGDDYKTLEVSGNMVINLAVMTSRSYEKFDENAFRQIPVREVLGEESPIKRKHIIFNSLLKATDQEEVAYKDFVTAVMTNARK